MEKKKKRLRPTSYPRKLLSIKIGQFTKAYLIRKAKQIYSLSKGINCKSVHQEKSSF